MGYQKVSIRMIIPHLKKCLFLQNYNFFSLDTGNEAVLEGVKISKDRLRNIENETLTDELKFTMESSDECKAECESR